MADPRAPGDLLRRGRKLWRAVVRTTTFEPDELELLAEVCRTTDLIADLSAAIAASGAVGADGRVVPAVVEARLQRDLLGRLLRQLALPDEGADDTVAASKFGRRGAAARWGRPQKKGS